MLTQNGCVEAQRALCWHWRESQVEIKLRYRTEQPVQRRQGMLP